MPIARVDLLVEDPDAVITELDGMPRGTLVRSLARETVAGWVVAAVFRQEADAAAFRSAHAEDMHDVAFARRRAGGTLKR